MMYKKHGRTAGKKGITMSEMCIVLALVSVVALAVVSFTTMVSAQSTASAVRLAAMEDLELTRSVLEGWLVQMEGKQIDVEENAMSATVSGQTYWISVEEGVLSARFLGSDPVSLPLKTVSHLNFDRMKNTDSVIYFCSVIYYIQHPVTGDLEQEFSFCIDPWLGETVN